MSNIQPQFPIFIPTLGRYESRYTIKALTRMKIERWYAVVEPQEYDLYNAFVPKEHLLTLDLSYKERYRTLSSRDKIKGTGSGPARNFIWDTSIKMGFAWHWIMDDNIRMFVRFHNNLKTEVLNGAFFRIMEDFVLRYENIAMAGPNYWMFVPRKRWKAPITMNTRIYSCNLIRNDVPYRWRGRYNEDTILSLDMLKDGWCTVLFNTFLQDKLATMSVKGGNTDSIYTLGTFEKSAMLVREYPQYARLAERFGRVHHYVDYSAFEKNLLRRRRDVEIPKEPNNYGLTLVANPNYRGRKPKK